MLIFISAGFILENLTKKNPVDFINAEKIQKVLIYKENYAERLVNEYAELLLKKSFSDVLITKQTELDNLYNEKGMSLLIYEGDELRFWSDNIISADIDILNAQSRAIYKNNHIFQVYKKSMNNKTFVVLINIKQTYLYNNRFLKSGFQKAFNIPSWYKISILQSDNDIQFFDKDGDFVFSLFSSKQFFFNKGTGYLSVFFYALAIIFYLLFSRYLFKKYFRDKHPIIGLFAVFVDLILLRFLMLYFKIPNIFYEFDIFKPHNFASSFWFSSLADFFINAVFILFFAILFFKYFIVNFNNNLKSQLKLSTYISVSILAINLLFLSIFYLLNIILLDSNISFETYNIFSLNLYSFVAFFIIAIIFAAFLLILNKILRIQKSLISINELAVFYFVISFVTFLLFYFIISPFDFYAPIYFIAIIAVMLTYLQIKSENKYAILILITFLTSIYTSLTIIETSQEKEQEKRKVLILNLSNQRDLIGELLFENVEKQLISDEVLLQFFKFPFENKEEVDKYIQQSYFHGYLSKYDFQTTICYPLDSLIMEPSNESFGCYLFFDNYISNIGIKISKSNFYFVENSNGRISYISKCTDFSDQDSTKFNFYIEIDSKLISEELGYPELLLDDKQKLNAIKEYSYAKYLDNELIAQNGDYKYSLVNTIMDNVNSEFTFVNKDNYNHLIYKTGDQKYTVLSKKNIEFSDKQTSIAYIFVFNFIALLIFQLISGLPYNFSNISLGFNNKILLSIIGILLVLFVIITIVTVYYNTNFYKQKQYDTISEKTQSVLIEIEHKLGEIDAITSENHDYILYLLTKFSNVFYSDLNLYAKDGKLIQSSRPEILEKGLIANRMNPVAYREMAVNMRSVFVHTEQIGKLSYQSSYVPFKNNNNKILAYLNLPYFTKQNQIKKEVSTIIVAIINVYVLVLVIAMLIAVLISNQITKPLRLIQSKLKAIKLNEQTELIDYQSNDEIGDLVAEYNEMAQELKANIQQLAKSERDSAWREMAKQIAHEIKNPLTPMKLSVQFLKRSWDNNSENFDEQINKTTKILIEQINSLAGIATAFSDFAAMPMANNERINVKEILDTVIQTFSKTPSCKIGLAKQYKENYFVFADYNQLLRVFNNIIKNSIQAIPESRLGNIIIDIENKNNTITIKISDNGIGISEEIKDKLFVPNFTTKSSGSGLGLAMVKNIIENANGEIWFDTEIEKGTTFFIKFMEWRG